ncbi:MAG TPA: hypothetical protein DD672_03980, partial [Gammaproteobacteria bacterium]|nr:hypothetical protein [Gammaproteobacteria bacterium]
MKITSFKLAILTMTGLLLASCGEESPSPQSALSESSISVPNTPKGLDYAFYKEAIEPIFMRPRGGYIGSDAGCVACHASQANAPLGLQP